MDTGQCGGCQGGREVGEGTGQTNGDGQRPDLGWGKHPDTPYRVQMIRCIIVYLKPADFY